MLGQVVSSLMFSASADVISLLLPLVTLWLLHITECHKFTWLSSGWPLQVYCWLDELASCLDVEVLYGLSRSFL
jgi:hypothetical protein